MKASDPPPPSLWRDADFRRLWIGQTASHLGAQAGQVILPLIAVVALSADTQQIGVLRAVQQAPILLLSLFVGAWVDRRRSRNVMVLADFGRTVVLAVVPVAYLLGILDIPLLVLVAFLVGALTVYFDVAYQTSLVRLVSRGRLAQGNSALEGSRSAAQIAGPALGGALVSLLTAPVAIVASAFFFTLSFLSIRRIRRPEPMPAPAVRQARVGRQIRQGLRLIVRDALLRAVGISSALFQFSFAALMTVYLLFLPRTLHLSGAAVGLVLAAMGPGALVGSLLSARLPKRYGYGVVLVSAAVLADGVMLGVPALRGSSTGTIAALMAVNFLFGVFSQLVDVIVVTVRQAVTPISIQGRVVATINFVGMGLTPLGSLLGGCLAGALGLRTSLLLTAVTLALSPLFMALSPLARLGRDLPGTVGEPDG
ncbi:MFS transporter [Nonomuraea africana]|uniref:MFS family arabinose efflux permease n=1 Tax=Nonomuraea africana TaxID=46171 RepID=A0ABR9KB38_9ACTN|nr:MFS transporter [Nonomuraea africana]MBE1559233.1 putative MFS family arabinose efflux permease [Nonomuraea africana]